ncbi:transcription elongation factor A protein 2 [Striga asiatica]|uniref:Transcription elongation factor A protein 2 n=1 Tax=Striga asiatica TaxID=4170 RepID=A0A5A7R908_STRAF|nr:transcription elongation factor A protein 2 [Striga asiatica]
MDLICFTDFETLYLILDLSDEVLFDSLRRLQLMHLFVETLKATEIGKSVNALHDAGDDHEVDGEDEGIDCHGRREGEAGQLQEEARGVEEGEQKDPSGVEEGVDGSGWDAAENIFSSGRR